MITTEDRLRAAAQAAAATVRPDSVPPLQLPVSPARRPRLFSRIRPMAPLAAALSVIVAISAAIALTHTIRERPPAPRSAAAGRLPLSAVPRFYATLSGVAGMPDPVVIRATATGQVLATVTPPRPYRGFTFISGAADDRTFVLAAQRWWQITPGSRGQAAEIRDGATRVVFFRLRFDPATRAARLTPLSAAGQISAADLAGIALSPDGSRLALTVRPAGIKVITLATGAARDWAWPGNSGIPASDTGGAFWVGNAKPYGDPMSWTSDGRTLAFQLWTRSGGITEVRLLDTRAPGSSLRSARRCVAFIGLGHVKDGPLGNTIITPDGTRVVAVTRPHGTAQAQLTEYSASTGQPVSTPGRGAAGRLVPWDVLWTSRDGSTVIVSIAAARYPAPSAMGIVWHGRLTVLPGAPSGAVNIAW